MIKALQMTVSAINRHGISMSYTSIVTGAYNVELSKVVNTRTTTTLKMYPKQFIANQYNFPNLIGKETVLFYLPNNSLSFIPKLGDEITYKGSVYRVQSIQEHFADGTVALYKLIAAKG